MDPWTLDHYRTEYPWHVLLVPYESLVIAGVCTDRLAGFKLLKLTF